MIVYVLVWERKEKGNNEFGMYNGYRVKKTAEKEARYWNKQIKHNKYSVHAIHLKSKGGM